MKKLNTSIKHNLFIGIFVAIWVFMFAFFIRPFDNGTLHFSWTHISISFSLIALICYGAVTVLQDIIYQKVMKWNWGFELGIHLGFYLLYLFVSFAYYKSPFFQGSYSFVEFFNVIFKSTFVLAPILILSRYFALSLIPTEDEVLTIHGDNKLDILRINKSDLVCITNVQNYVEIFFVEGNQLHSRLIRSSLKKIRDDLDFVIQVHRSHLINPSHFKFWKSNNVIALTQKEVPVSQKYRDAVLSL